MKRLTIAVPGKIILSGEHAVVHGRPAIVAAVDRKLCLVAEWEKDDTGYFRGLLRKFEEKSAAEIIENIRSQGVELKIESEIPLGCGMGSSAALAGGVSLLTLVLAGRDIDLQEVNRLAYLLERQTHGNPSGIDNTVAVFGGVKKYQRKGEKILIEEIRGLGFIKEMWLVNTGKPAETTKQMVEKVNRLWEKKREETEEIFDEIAKVTKRFLLKKEIKSGIERNERALERLGVVSNKTKKLIREIEKRGGAAKISGAGGKKTNSGIVIIYGFNEEIREYLKRERFKFFPARICEGIKFGIDEE